MSDPIELQSLSTLAVHAGSPREGNAPLTQPIVQAITFRFEGTTQLAEYARGEAGESPLFMYSRSENPTVRAAEAAVASLEGGESCILFASGMGAMSCAVLGLASGGDKVIASSALYGGTFKLLRDVVSRFGVRARFVDADQLATEVLRGGEGEGARLCIFESPINPTLQIVDIAAVASACRRAGVVSLFDSTFGTPFAQRPLSLGVDVVMHSTSKYMNGHSDHLSGALVGSQARIAPLRKLSHALGATLDPQVASALLRGLKTFPLRMERHCSNALAVAQWLARDPRVSKVYYPGLPGHPDHALAAQQMHGRFGGMVAFSVASKERAFRLWDRLRLIARAASLGGVESLSSLPILFSQTGFSPDELSRAGIDEGLVRLSVGIEDVRDIIADLDQALAA